MKNTKDKILKALGCSLEDISEERLLDILLDAYKAKKLRIDELVAENASEREKLRQDQESIRVEMDRMRRDPLYGASGVYFFEANGHQFYIQVEGKRISAYERADHIDYAARQLSREEWRW